MTVYGYARVSTIGQTLAAQEATLHEAGAAKVFKEKISGAANHRAQLHRLLRAIEVGDAVIVTETRSAGAINAGLAQHPRQDREGGRDIQVTWRRLGRYVYGPRTTDADGSWRAC